MDTKFQRPNKAALTNAQYFSFMTAFLEQLGQAAFTANAILTRKTALEQQVALVDKYLKIQQGSYLSQEIYDTDHRGDRAYGTAHSVVLAWLGKEFQPQATAAEMLNRVFKLYKINTSAQYDEQWGLVDNFLTDIRKPELADHIQTLGIGAPLQVLGECSTQMKALIRQRDDETNGKVKGALVQSRKDCDKAYNDVLDIIEAAALMADNATPYYEFITRWNTALDRYIQQIIDKKGGKSGGTNNNGGTGTNTPGTDTPGTDTPGTDTPGTDTPGTDTPGTDTPGTDTPGTDTPGTGGTGTITPGDNTDPDPDPSDNPGGGSGSGGTDEN